MGGFKSRLKNRLTRHASASNPAGEAVEGVAETANNPSEHASSADLDDTNPSSSAPPSSLRDADHQDSLQHQRLPSSTTEESLVRKQTNTSVASTQEALPSPPLPQSDSASVANSTRSLRQDSQIRHRHSQSANAASTTHPTDSDANKALSSPLERKIVGNNEQFGGTACFDYAVDPGERPPTSGATSNKSRDIATLDSSTWTEAVPPSIDENPELVLQEPSPDSNFGTTSPVAEILHQSASYSTAPTSSGPVYTPTTTQQMSYGSLNSSRMGLRKVWVKRPGGAATLVSVRDDDMVDDAKDMILRKYGNSLGRQFDAPDVVIKLVPRGENISQEVILSPDEELCRAMDKYYHGSQKMTEALIIHVPHKKTPKHSPGQLVYHHHHGAYYPIAEESRPHESGTEYFPLVHPSNVSPGPSVMHEARAMSVLTTGQLPPLASPGGTRRALGSRTARPNFVRHSTASPTGLTTTTSTTRGNRPRLDSGASVDKHSPSTAAAPLSTPPVADIIKGIPNPPTPRVSSPRPRNRRPRQKPPSLTENPTLPPSIIDTSVPPINVLIVEDNMINMKLLEQFVRRLKVHWATAVNGREAVQKWRQGGFHLVLMDIQLPIMSGLDATREIRRLERVNHIGVLSGSPHSSLPPTIIEGAEEDNGEIKEEDKLGDTARMFKSPVIIVALTASNLQSDRHEALAAGCNDFLTKPVNFVWFERKVKEWGCMQALIDFDGWRKWKDNAVQNGLKDASNPRQGSIKRSNKPDKLIASNASSTLGSSNLALSAATSVMTNSDNKDVAGATPRLTKEGSEDTVTSSA